MMKKQSQQIFGVDHQGITQEAYEKQIRETAQALGFESHNLNADYTWRAVMIKTTYGGCQAVIVVSQSYLRDPSTFEGCTPGDQGQVYTYISTPETQSQGQGFYLAEFSGKVAANAEILAIMDKGPLSRKQVLTLSRNQRNRAVSLAGQWFCQKVEELSK